MLRRGAPTAALAVVTVAIFTDTLVYGLVVPILPRHVAALGLPEWAVGVLFGSYAVALLVATPVFGALADRVGRRRPLVGGLLGLGSATLLFAYAPICPFCASAAVVLDRRSVPVYSVCTETTDETV